MDSRMGLVVRYYKLAVVLSMTGFAIEIVVTSLSECVQLVLKNRPLRAAYGM